MYVVSYEISVDDAVVLANAAYKAYRVQTYTASNTGCKQSVEMLRSSNEIKAVQPNSKL